MGKEKKNNTPKNHRIDAILTHAGDNPDDFLQTYGCSKKNFLVSPDHY